MYGYWKSMLKSERDQNKEIKHRDGGRWEAYYWLDEEIKGRIPRHRHRHPREDRRDNVGVGVVECGLNDTELPTATHAGRMRSASSTRDVIVRRHLRHFVSYSLCLCSWLPLMPVTSIYRQRCPTAAVGMQLSSNFLNVCAKLVNVY